MKASVYFARVIALWEAIDVAAARASTYPCQRWHELLAPVGRGGAVHTAHPDTGESLCKRATTGPAEAGDGRGWCRDCQLLCNVLLNAENQARYWYREEGGWRSAPVPAEAHAAHRGGVSRER